MAKFGNCNRCGIWRQLDGGATCQTCQARARLDLGKAPGDLDQYRTCVLPGCPGEARGLHTFCDSHAAERLARVQSAHTLQDAGCHRDAAAIYRDLGASDPNPHALSYWGDRERDALDMAARGARGC